MRLIYEATIEEAGGRGVAWVDVIIVCDSVHILAIRNILPWHCLILSRCDAEIVHISVDH